MSVVSDAGNLKQRNGEGNAMFKQTIAASVLMLSGCATDPTYTKESCSPTRVESVGGMPTGGAAQCKRNQTTPTEEIQAEGQRICDEVAPDDRERALAEYRRKYKLADASCGSVATGPAPNVTGGAR